METIGESIQKSLAALESGEFENSFAAACAALKLTLEKSLETDALSNGDYQDFVGRNWRMLVSAGFPKALPLPSEVNRQLKTAIYGFSISSADQLVVHLVRQTAAMNRTPVQFKFHRNTVFESRGNQIYIPQTLVGALINTVIFHSANKDESIDEKFWISLFDFKMFVSELWGRDDLAERILSTRR